ncbi:uncharacterized protein LY89DRAFT_649943 [Mollisia scopiformis]|uniref:Uncharacterized protein n=1 Tax=Mollisia scopiformis TaxID=149040 RepID=A0A194X213_MOLSC|nr:uncharacterized protein LY89DRAFT_649943 [Mollisia scopiformis]KUJ14236.1 hypothetical protein LY89DRAFT_649943 [Mollisia scopiformis]
MSFVTALLLFPLRSLAAPLSTREIQSIGSIDPSTDEWSSTLSGIGPLILLVGERTTQQVLRNVHSRSSAFSLAASPLGLLSVVTSLIRFCGTQQLRAFIGYELEARTVSGIEVTRVNCGGVTAHLTHGYVVRSIVANPASRLIAVSILEGNERGLEECALERIRASERFEKQKRKLDIPDGEANVDWCMHITLTDVSDESLNTLVQTLARAVGVDPRTKKVNNLERSLILGLRPSGNANHNDGTGRKYPSSTSSPLWNFSFMTTFDAVSEFTTRPPTRRFHGPIIGVLSFLGIITVHLLALWHNGWVMSIGWILVMIGYFGIVLGVLFASLLISSSCISIHLDTSYRNSSRLWKDGMIISVKNVDSMDTTGSAFVSCPQPHQNLEAIYIKPSTRQDRSLASFITISLIFAFIAHYLGLRAIKWWASIGELGICIIAAFARSVSNDAQPRFKEVEGMRIDKRCSSTGIIVTQSARLIDEHTEPTYKVDGRSYALKLLNNTPIVGERVAYQMAKLCINDEAICTLLTKLTGLRLVVSSSSSSLSVPIRSVLVSFTGGILVSEGLAAPAPQLILSFQAKISDLAAPTSLLSRIIMRQLEWCLQTGVGKGIPLGNVYVFAMQSMLDWWTVSEDRNDMADLQKNLYWPMLLVNCAFFLECLKMEKEDDDLVKGLAEVHGEGEEGDAKVANDVVNFLRAWE